MSLKNDKEIYSFLLQLDKTKERDYAFRKYLEESSEQGISKKEAILRMLEVLQNNGFIEDNKLKL